MFVDVDAGELNHRIALQKVTKTKDEEGNFNDVWATVQTCWARVKPMSSKQKTEYKSVEVEATHLIKVRGSITVEESYQVLFKEREFEILTVDDEKEMGIAKWIVTKERRK